MSNYSIAVSKNTLWSGVQPATAYPIGVDKEEPTTVVKDILDQQVSTQKAAWAAVPGNLRAFLNGQTAALDSVCYKLQTILNTLT